MSDINFCNTKEQLNHLGEVVTGKVDGSPTGADIDTSTLPYTGQVRKTLPALEEEYQADIDNFVQVSDQIIIDKTTEFDASIASKEAEADAAIDAYRLLSKGPYAAGILLEDKFQYITYNGESYFAVNPPYTTTATTPDTDGNLFAGGYLTSQQLSLYTDIVYKESGGNSAVENMIAGIPVTTVIGDNCKCENGTVFKREGNANGDIRDYTPISDVVALDFGTVEDGVSDDTVALNLSVKSINNYKNTGATLGECQGYRSTSPRRLIVTGLLRYTETLFIPSGVLIDTVGQSYFSKDVKRGLFYDPVNLQTSAVSTLLYIKNGATYDLSYDNSTIPDGSDFDNLTYVTGSWGVPLDFNLITSPGVKVGIWWVGGNSTNSKNLSIGDANGNIPNVGAVVSASWGSNFEHPNVLSAIQSFVFSGSNAGVTVNRPYVSRIGSAEPDAVDMVYKPTGLSKSGSCGFTLLNNTVITINDPIIEQFWLSNVVSEESSLTIRRPHIESTAAKILHNFVMYSGRVYIDGTGLSVTQNYLTDPNASIFYFQNCTIGQHTAEVVGSFDYYNCRLALGESSGPVLRMSDIDSSQFRYGEIGDFSLIDSVSNVNKDLYVFVDGNSGKDSHWGMNSSAPVKTLQAAFDRASKFKLGDVQISGDLYESTATLVEGDVDINLRGLELFMQGGGAQINVTGSLRLNLMNEGISTDTTSLFLISGGSVRLSVHNSPTVLSLAASFFNYSTYGDAELTVFNSNISATNQYAVVGGSGVGFLNINVKTNQRNTAYDDLNLIDDNVVVNGKVRAM